MTSWTDQIPSQQSILIAALTSQTIMHGLGEAKSKVFHFLLRDKPGIPSWIYRNGHKVLRLNHSKGTKRVVFFLQLQERAS